MGILTETRNGMNGPYSVVVYNWEAQQFLFDNIDAAIEMYRKKTENQGLTWSPKLDQLLRELYQKGLDTEEIATTLKRNRTAIRARLKKLDITA